jgi:hypothetical protein
LSVNQRVRLHVEPIDAPAQPPRGDFSAWLGMGLREPQNPNPRLPDDDSLWAGSLGEDVAGTYNQPHGHGTFEFKAV